MQCRVKAGRAMVGLLTAAFLFAASALAQQRGFYIRGSLGQSEHSDQCSGGAAGITCDDKDTAWKIFGGYQFNQYFAALPRRARPHVTNNIAVRGEWQRYTDVGEITDIDVLSIGALFKF